MKYYEDPILGKGRAADVSGGTGGANYVAGDGIEISGNTISANDISESSVIGLTDLADGTQSVQKDLSNARYIYLSPSSNKALTLLHLSDIHGDATTLNRIVADANELASVDNIICTGDMVQAYASNISSWWNPVVMTAIGNHDTQVYGISGWVGLSVADRIAYYIAPFESNWGITRGEGESYYYKDYTTQGVRLIVIDVMLYYNGGGADATAQTAWLSNLLFSAITSNLHVLIATHVPHKGSISRICSFSRVGEPDYADVMNVGTPDEVINAVASAINNGLHFVGYISGHNHRDNVWDATGDGTQYMISVAAASAQPGTWGQDSDSWRSETLDAWNLLTIDTEHTIVKIVRGGGANIDYLMRQREVISINYSTGQIIDREIARGVSSAAVDFRLVSDLNKLSVARFIDTINVSGSSVTIQAGYAYKAIVANNLTLNAESFSSQYGLTGMLDITLSGGTITQGSNVRFVNALQDGKRNICNVHFVDGVAIVDVITAFSTIPSNTYIVTSATGTADGSLYYGLATSTKNDISVSDSLSGQTLDLGGAVVNGAKNLYGNGAAQTIVSGSIQCVSATTFADLTASGVTVSGGKLDLVGGVTASMDLVSGTTVGLSGNNKVELITGTSAACVFSGGAIVDLTGNTNATTIAPGGGIVFASGGATVLVNGGTDSTSSSYMIDNVTFNPGTTITNAAVIDLAGLANHKTSNGVLSNVCLRNGVLSMTSSATANSLSLISSGRTFVFSGATVTNTIINELGEAYASEGGMYISTTVNQGGRLTVWRAANAEHITVNSGGTCYVTSAGTLMEPVINSGGSMTVSSAGTALLVTSNAGAKILVSSGGTITYKE